MRAQPVSDIIRFTQNSEYGSQGIIPNNEQYNHQYSPKLRFLSSINFDYRFYPDLFLLYTTI